MTKIYLIAEAALYVAFLALDLKGDMPGVADPLKMAAISLVFAYTLYRLVSEHKNKTTENGYCADRPCSAPADRALLCGAFFFAVAADIFLLFTDEVMIGIVLFCAVQTLHSVRMAGARNAAVRLCFRLSLAGFVFALLSGTLGLKGAELLLVVFYALSFADNICLAAKLPRRSRTAARQNLLLLAGLILFFMCDICVALYNAASFAGGTLEGGFMNVLATARPVTGLLMWFFYLPGQVMISLS